MLLALRGSAMVGVTLAGAYVVDGPTILIQLLLLVFVSVSAWWGLGQYIGNEWSALVVAAVWAVVALILFSAGKAELKRVQGLPKTTETLSKVPNALKGHEEENR